MRGAVGTLAHRCQLCDGTPAWTLTRRGDVMRTWACNSNLVMVAQDAQRSGERTELVMTVAAPERGREGKTK